MALTTSSESGRLPGAASFPVDPVLEQWRFAVAKDCTHGQGFYLGRPQPAGDLTPLLTPDSRVRT